MSWNWNPIEEEKEYDTKGTVTISTEEYRDLIRRTYELKTQGQKEHDDWYEQYNKNNELEKKNKALQRAIEAYNIYINSSDERKTDYATYLQALRLKELETESEV